MNLLQLIGSMDFMINVIDLIIQVKENTISKFGKIFQTASMSCPSVLSWVKKLCVCMEDYLLSIKTYNNYLTLEDQCKSQQKVQLM